MFDPKVIKTLALISQVGISMIVPVILMAWLGAWVDEKFSTQFFPLFLILGIGGGFRSVYNLIQQAMGGKSKDRKDDEKSDE
jgi:F0F1-type ATP synthase assembly protein I